MAENLRGRTTPVVDVAVAHSHSGRRQVSHEGLLTRRGALRTPVCRQGTWEGPMTSRCEQESDKSGLGSGVRLDPRRVCKPSTSTNGRPGALQRTHVRAWGGRVCNRTSFTLVSGLPGRVGFRCTSRTTANRNTGGRAVCSDGLLFRSTSRTTANRTYVRKHPGVWSLVPLYVLHDSE